MNFTCQVSLPLNASQITAGLTLSLGSQALYNELFGRVCWVHCYCWLTSEWSKVFWVGKKSLSSPFFEFETLKSRECRVVRRQKEKKLKKRARMFTVSTFRHVTCIIFSRPALRSFFPLHRSQICFLDPQKKKKKKETWKNGHQHRDRVLMSAVFHPV